MRRTPFLSCALLVLALFAPAAFAGPPGRDAVRGSLLERGQCLLGLAAFILLAIAIGRLRGARGRLPWRAMGWGVALQFVFALIVLQTPNLLWAVNNAIDALLGYTRVGAGLVFGNLATGDVPVTAPDGKPLGLAHVSAQFAFFVLPTIIFFSALTAVAYHSGVMQHVVRGLAWVMQRTMRTSGAETLAAAANIFVGQTEAPLLVKPFVAAATRSELMAIMVGGFANIASGVLGVYTAYLQPYIADVGGHLAAACFISAPASLLVAKLLLPETETPPTAGGLRYDVERIDANLIDAAARGTTEGVALAINVGAMLIAFTALVAMTNALLAWAGRATHLEALTGPLTLDGLFGLVMAPLAWLSGVAWADARDVGALLGVKTVLNEFVAYAQMRDRFAQNPTFITPRSAVLAAYALCGFANFASIGIQVGGISTMAPTRRADLSRLALLAMIGGAITSFMTACVVGVLL